jgi:hypothetical protein
MSEGSDISVLYREFSRSSSVQTGGSRVRSVTLPAGLAFQGGGAKMADFG